MYKNKQRWDMTPTMTAVILPTVPTVPCVDSIPMLLVPVLIVGFLPPCTVPDHTSPVLSYAIIVPQPPPDIPRAVPGSFLGREVFLLPVLLSSLGLPSPLLPAAVRGATVDEGILAVTEAAVCSPAASSCQLVVAPAQFINLGKIINNNVVLG